MSGLFADEYRVPVEPYRPSNGTEGLIFQHAFCSRCIRDKAARENPPRWEAGCPILAAALLLNPGEEGYPEEWVYSPKTGQPTCTAFEQDPDEPTYEGERPPFPLPSELMGAYLQARTEAGS